MRQSYFELSPTGYKAGSASFVEPVQYHKYPRPVKKLFHVGLRLQILVAEGGFLQLHLSLCPPVSIFFIEQFTSLHALRIIY